MIDPIVLKYDVDGHDFASAGMASTEVKSRMKQLGINPQIVRKIAICMYEAEINLVIHGGGGTATVEIYPDRVELIMADKGKGIENIELAMQEGYTTAPDNIRSLGFGAGMGLPNMKKYSDKIKVESTVGVGTTVYMTINLQ